MSIDFNFIEIACVIDGEKSLKRFNYVDSAHNLVSNLVTENFAFANVHYLVNDELVTTRFDILENLVYELSK